MKNRLFFKVIVIVLLFLGHLHVARATNYTVSTKTDLQDKMTAALPGDTVILVNGTYNWGQTGFKNTNGTETSAWIVLKAQTLNGVVFTSNTYLQFGGKRILVMGFKFAKGNTGLDDVVQFRSPSGTSCHYCRLKDITIDNYNSDSTGAYLGTSIDNKWVSIYGTNNRVDHCTFINKSNAGATLVVWLDNPTYPQKSTPTYHKIDSNYFKGRSFFGGNGGESIRISTSANSRSYSYNIVEYNLFEGLTQAEPEIISNKSGFNIYRYNTIKNSKGGITMRHGRYCSIYGNFIIVTDPSVTQAYGIRLIDKGHSVYNNYLEGLNGNKGSLTSLRCPIILYNGFYAASDTTDPNHTNIYWPADSTTIAFNTIVNCQGGAGVVLGFSDSGSNPYQPLGIKIGNNLIKMSSGQAMYKETANNLLTYAAEGNIYDAPSGLGSSVTTGFTNTPMIFGARTNGILTPPSFVQNAAVNTPQYAALLGGLDAQQQTRNAVYNVGCDELNGTGKIISVPLDSNMVGAGKPLALPTSVAQNTEGGVSVSIYPNPTRDFICIDFKDTVTEPISLVLFDAVGKVVEQKTVLSQTNRLPVHNLAKGLYHFQIIEGNKVMATYPFVIQ